MLRRTSHLAGKLGTVVPVRWARAPREAAARHPASAPNAIGTSKTQARLDKWVMEQHSGREPTVVSRSVPPWLLFFPGGSGRGQQAVDHDIKAFALEDVARVESVGEIVANHALGVDYK